jgi:hypothetical protein
MQRACSRESLGRRAKERPTRKCFGAIPVSCLGRRETAEHPWIHDVSAGGGLDDPFEAVPSPSVLDVPEETSALQFAHRIVHPLTGKLERLGHRGRGSWLLEPFENHPAKWIEERSGRLGVPNEADVAWGARNILSICGHGLLRSSTGGG